MLGEIAADVSPKQDGIVQVAISKISARLESLASRKD